MPAATEPEATVPVEDHPALKHLRGSVGTLSKLPMLPVTATRAMAMTKASDCSLKKLAAVIETDPVLAAGVLKLANSALYSFGHTVSGLELAIVRLGLRECSNLIFTVGMRSLFLKLRLAQRKPCETLWQHSFLTACLCRRLNEALQLGYRGEEFSAGLFHDLGRLLFALGVPEKFASVDPLDFRDDPEVLIRERDEFGLDHGSFGAWFAQVNELPVMLSHASQFHHAPEQAPGHQALVALVAAADDMANHMQREKNVERYTPDATRGWSLLGLYGHDETSLRAAARLPAIMAEALLEAKAVMGLSLR